MVKERKKKSSHSSRSPNSHRPRRSKPIPKNLPVSPALHKSVSATLDEGCYIVFDIETTGGNPEKNGITEIFALRYHRGEIIDTFYSLVDPGIPIPPIVRRMTGITNKMLKGEPRIDKVMPGVLEFVRDDVLVSHNTIGDMKFLRYFAEKCCGVEMGNFYLCTHLLVEKLAQEAPDKSLKGLAEHFDLPAEKDLHRAEADAYVTLELFRVLLMRLKRAGIKKINEAIRLQSDLESGMRMGWGITKDQPKAPASPGVFYLYDHQDNMIFLSGSMALDREIKKLGNYQQLPRQLLRTILKAYDIKYEESPNPFAALLAECEALERNDVLFQPMNWHQRSVHAVNIIQEKNGIRITTGPLVAGVKDAFGPVRDRKEAQIYLERLAEVFGHKNTRKGLVLPKSLETALVSIFSGTIDQYVERLEKEKASLVNLVRPKRRKAIEDLIASMKKVSTIRLRPKWLPLLETSGVVSVPTKGHKGWDLYCIHGAQPVQTLSVKAEVLDVNGDTRLKSQILKKVSGRPVAKNRPLKRIEANKANATLWYIYSGRGQNRFMDVSDLQ